MPIKPGDRVTVSFNPTIKLADYTMLKPFASLTRDVQNDADVAELHCDAIQLLHTVARNELRMLVNANNALGAGCDTEALDSYLAQEITHARPQTETIPRSPDTFGAVRGTRPKRKI